MKKGKRFDWPALLVLGLIFTPAALALQACTRCVVHAPRMP